MGDRHAAAVRMWGASGAKGQRTCVCMYIVVTCWYVGTVAVVGTLVPLQLLVPYCFRWYRTASVAPSSFRDLANVGCARIWAVGFGRIWAVDAVCSPFLLQEFIENGGSAKMSTLLIVSQHFLLLVNTSYF